jgi:hypothetical protein
MKWPSLEFKDYVSNGMSFAAILISILVWRTADTRASELRDKLIRYSVAQSMEYLDSPPHGPIDKWGFHTYLPDEKEDLINESQGVEVTITNAGKLPVKDVSLTISTSGGNDTLPPHEVHILPAKVREESVTGADLVIHLKNALGPNEQVVARVDFTLRKDRKLLAKDFSLDEAFVESEVGAATLVGSLKGGMDKKGSMQF